MQLHRVPVFQVIHKNGPGTAWMTLSKQRGPGSSGPTISRLMEPLGHIPPREFEENYYRQTEYQKAA